jgi:hypothetical protein
MGFKDYLGKRIYAKLNSGRVYSGVVTEVTYIGKNQDGAELYLIMIIDKFGSAVAFSNTEINILDEERWQ